MYTSKSKLVLSECNDLYFIAIAFIAFTLHEIKHCPVFFGTPVRHHFFGVSWCFVQTKDTRSTNLQQFNISHVPKRETADLVVSASPHPQGKWHEPRVVRACRGIKRRPVYFVNVQSFSLRTDLWREMNAISLSCKVNYLFTVFRAFLSHKNKNKWLTSGIASPKI